MAVRWGQLRATGYAGSFQFVYSRCRQRAGNVVYDIISTTSYRRRREHLKTVAGQVPIDLALPQSSVACSDARALTETLLTKSLTESN